MIATLTAWQSRLDRLSLPAWALIAAYTAISATAARIAWIGSGRTRLAGTRPGTTGPGASRPEGTREVLPWLVASVTMLVLGLNRLLDADDRILWSLRRRATAAGWYDERRAYQALGVVVIGLAGLTATALVVRRMRRVSSEAKWAAFGLGLLLSYIAIRSVSLHQIDHVLNSSELHVRFVIEFAGVVLVGWPCVLRWWRLRRRGDVGSDPLIERSQPISSTSA